MRRVAGGGSSFRDVEMGEVGTGKSSAAESNQFSATSSAAGRTVTVFNLGAPGSTVVYKSNELQRNISVFVSGLGDSYLTLYHAACAACPPESKITLEIKCAKEGKFITAERYYISVEHNKVETQYELKKSLIKVLTGKNDLNSVVFPLELNVIKKRYEGRHIIDVQVNGNTFGKRLEVRGVVDLHNLKSYHSLDAYDCWQEPIEGGSCTYIAYREDGKIEGECRIIYNLQLGDQEREFTFHGDVDGRGWPKNGTITSKHYCQWISHKVVNPKPQFALGEILKGKFKLNQCSGIFKEGYFVGEVLLASDLVVNEEKVIAKGIVTTVIQKPSDTPGWTVSQGISYEGEFTEHYFAGTKTQGQNTVTGSFTYPRWQLLDGPVEETMFIESFQSKVIMKYTLVNGKKHGQETVKSSSNIALYTITYDNGKVTKEEYYDRNRSILTVAYTDPSGIPSFSGEGVKIDDHDDCIKVVFSDADKKEFQFTFMKLPSERRLFTINPVKLLDGNADGYYLEARKGGSVLRAVNGKVGDICYYQNRYREILNIKDGDLKFARFNNPPQKISTESATSQQMVDIGHTIIGGEKAFRTVQAFMEAMIYQVDMRITAEWVDCGDETEPGPPPPAPREYDGS